ncbi:MAG: hypothetical protein KIS86_00335 [Devosia sp.]|nr:hypothetical protein [Devosia sp.]
MTGWRPGASAMNPVTFIGRDPFAGGALRVTMVGTPFLAGSGDALRTCVAPADLIFFDWAEGDDRLALRQTGLEGEIIFSDEGRQV